YRLLSIVAMHQSAPRQGSLLALLLTSDARQSLRIQRSLSAAMVYVVCSCLIVYGVWIKIAQAFEGYLLIAAMLGSCGLFYAALRSGWNQRFKDPSLTLPQILAALTWCVCSYGIANEAHGGMLMPLALVLVFGVFNMSPQQALIASGYALMTLGSMMLYKSLTDPSVYNPGIQSALFLMAMAIVPTIAGIAAKLSKMRRRIKQHKAELAAAMRRFQTSGEVPDAIDAAISQQQDELWQQFAELAHQRRELDERRSMMLAAISHDLRSPLGRIRMAAELLPKAQGVEVRRESIVRNVDVANRLLTDFIDMARADHEPIADRVDLSALVLDITQGITDLRLLELPQEPQWLAPASAIALERALSNLIDNAHIYGAPPIEMGLRCDDTTLIWVRDYGPGVDPAQYKHLLQPFTRAEANRLRPGTGLGLAIVHRTVARHQGKVVLMDAKPGLRVELHLPRCEPQV
ncbi:MAG: ATP-binding protein, partial [Brachymonas sp.]